jgi:acetyl esterase/lipase
MIDKRLLWPVVGFTLVWAPLTASCAPSQPTATIMPSSTATSVPSTPTATVEQADSTILSQLDIPYGPDEQQKLDVFYNEEFVDAPIIVLIHSPGWENGDKVLMHTAPEDLQTLQGPEYSDEVRYWATRRPTWGRELAQYFVDLGLVAVTPNFRLLTRDVENAFPAPVNDVACAAVWTKQNAVEFGGDASTMFVAGYSAGAHIGAMLAYNTERDWLEECPIRDEELTFKGFIGLAGIYDFTATRLDRFSTSLCFLLSDLLDLEGLEVYKCLEDPDFGKWAEANPVDHVSPGDPPALLVTGDDDCLLNFPDRETGLCTANTDRFAAVLSDAGIRADVLVLPGVKRGPSGVLDPSEIGEAVEEFLKHAR